MQKILKKILDELNKDKPNIDYIRGMVEAVVEDEFVKVPIGAVRTTLENTIAPVDEGTLMDTKAKAAIAEVKRLADISTSTNAIKN